ncbi:putative glycoside hydrolase family 18, catalytic domain, glycoside hydrolase superfamily [Dioscorea sansibarensis]
MAAAKRRDRRASADTSAGGRSGKPAQTHRTRPMASSICRSPFVFFFSFFLVFVPLALYFILRNPRSGSPILSVYERGLVKPNVAFLEILAEHSRVSENRTRKHFENPVLAYVTPWNSRGYEMAKLFSSKVTHVSPVWYELKSKGKDFVLEGRHNADAGWISDLQKNGHSLVLPRVVLEAFPAEFITKKKQWRKAIDIIVKECEEMGYDGIVLESWSRWDAYGVLQDPDMRLMALKFIKHLGEALHSVTSTTNSSHHLELIYVIPAPRSQNLGEYDFGPQDYQELKNAVDGFSLMTYDFSSPQSPGPNAPLQWIRSSLQLLLSDAEDGHMIFLGINFYGNDFVLSGGSGGGAITGWDYISLLEKHKPSIRWEEKSEEHYFVYTSNNHKHAVFYPSLMSISTRLNEARNWGAALSIWEIGQGLDYFFDLL